MLKPIRYSSNNGALHIGTQYNKLTVFTRERCARLELGINGLVYQLFGWHTFHFGNWGC